MSRKPIALVLMAALVAATATTAGYACFMRSIQPVQVWMDHIEVEIKDNVAVKTYDCTFKNPNPTAVVGGTCYMELEPGAQVDDMRVLVNGKELRAEILDVDKAKQVFQDIVKEGGSPALLEYYGNQLIQTQVPRVPPNGTVNVQLTYTTVLEKRGGLVRLQMLNTNPKALMQPLKSASVNVKITSSTPIKNVYSPTHKIDIVEVPDADVAVQWDQEEYLPKHPFVLYYQTAEDPVGASVLTHRELAEPGTFMMMLSPTVGSGEGAITEKDIMPKDIVFCVDTSGSMLDGNKMEQARKALEYCVKHMRPGDRFNIVDFSTAVRTFNEDGMVAYDEESLQRAMNYINRLAPRGGTAIQEALEKSLELLDDDKRLRMILFATDGLPTIGERDPEAILRKISKQNQKDVRIFVFGEGFDVNTKLLDFLALNNRGEADYILPEEDIAEKISQFYDRVGSPIMTDLKVEFDGVKAEDVFPRSIPDLFKGEQVVVFGRYTGSGTATVRVTGTIHGEERTFEYELDFAEVSEDDKASFIPRLWAGRKIDFLLGELRKSDAEDPELVEEVTHLAKRYGIVTPYTSYLMAEDVVAEGFTGTGPGGGAVPPGKLPMARFKQRLRVLNAAAEPSADAAPGDKKAAVEASKELSEARRNFGKSGAADDLYRAAELQLGQQGGRDGSSLAAIRYIGNLTFFKAPDSWYDSRFDPQEIEKKDIKTVKVGSDKYFELLGKHTELAKYLALTDVVLKFDGQWYRFESEKKAEKK